MSSRTSLTAAIRSALALGASAGLLVTGAVQAQTNPTEPQAEDRTERIQVTGSRISRPGDISPTPLTVITGDGLVDAGVVNVADLLHQMPNTLVGLSPETTNNSVFASGLNNTDLRGLGSQRTLVLVNGRRFIAGAPGSGAVDLNNIPTAMIDRVEITTGGASAVYGSDAVAGVVNIVTKTSFEGVEIDASTSRPFESGGEEDFVSLTFGSSSGRANFVTNLSVTRSQQLKASDRDYLYNQPIVLQNPEFDPDDPNSNRLHVWGYGQQRLAQYSPYTDFFGSDGGRYTFTQDGQVRPFDFGEALPYPTGSDTQAYYGPGDGYVYADQDYFRTPLNRINFTSHMNYEFNQDHTMNLEVNFAKTDAYGESSPAFLIMRGANAIQPDNAFLPDNAAGLIGEDGATATYLANDFGNRQYSQDRYLARAALSFEGYLTNNWMYDVYATVAHVQSDTEWYGEIFEDRFHQAIDAVSVDGQIQCRDNTGGCVPLNIFGTNNFSDEAFDWVSTDAIRRASIGQTALGATVNGDLFELPAGFVAAAFSAEWREERASTMPDPAMRAGLLFNNQSQPLSGSFEVAEISAELSIPLMRDLPFAQYVSLETAGRAMEYSTSGSDTAWKIGLNWEVNDELRIRANRSKSVRAPNIGELYNPPGQTFRSLTDPCAVSQRDALNPEYRDNILANCAAHGIDLDSFEPSDDWKGTTNPGYIVGNQDLENEVAKDMTIGFVYTPSQLPDFSITVDYWDFELSNVIQSYTGPNLVQYCYRSSSLDNPYCPLIERDSETGEISNYYETPVNAALSDISGWDVEASYRYSSSFGDFGFRLIGTYLSERKINSTGFAEDEVNTLGEQSRPRWRHRFVTNYNYGDFAATLNMTYRHNTVLSRDWSPNQNDYNDVPSYTQFDLTTRYNVTQNLQVRAGLLNMFDRNPARQPGVYSQGQYYDILGRRATLGVNYSF